MVNKFYKIMIKINNKLSIVSVHKIFDLMASQS